MSTLHRTRLCPTAVVAVAMTFAIAGCAGSGSAQRPDLAELPPAFEPGDGLSASPTALLFVDYDADGDRRTTAAERDSGIARDFQNADGDDNGAVDPAEYSRWARVGLGSEFASPSQQQIDRDGNRQIAPEEFALALRQAFLGLDLDKNDALTRNELVSPRAAASLQSERGGRKGPPGDRRGGRPGRPPGG